MNPVFCFYKDDQYLFSENYTLVEAFSKKDADQLLEDACQLAHEKTIIIQVNFEYGFESKFETQTKLYPSAILSVFKLNSYSVVDKSFIGSISKKTGLSLPTKKFEPLVSKETFIKNVVEIKNEISKGRIYQVNLTAPLKSQNQLSAVEIYRYYQDKFSGNYSALLPLKNTDLISFSPELFLSKNKSLLTTRPIKGSIKPDDNSSEKIIKDIKEDSELSMIVDLLRNDLNSIENSADATVTKHRALMNLNYIQHTYSEICIKTQKNAYECLSKTLPGGSISGCPKIESLNLISEIEPYQRQHYTGVHGWIESGDFTLALTIRSFIKNQDSLYYHAGCGIVYDSDPEKEWSEFLLKTGSINAHI